MNYNVFPTPLDLAESLASRLSKSIDSAFKRNSLITIALSGGNTPKLLFSVLKDNYADNINWRSVHLFWVDERCVAPDDKESNYGMTAELLPLKTAIPPGNVHRIRGEDDPGTEADRYSREILKYTGLRNGLPEFDIVILGMGEDGHTASIFPGNMDLINSKKICEVAIHPVTGQYRVTLTGPVINNAKDIIFMVSGSNKASVVAEIIGSKPKRMNYPATYINSVNGSTTWYLDSEAAGLL